MLRRLQYVSCLISPGGYKSLRPTAHCVTASLRPPSSALVRPSRWLHSDISVQPSHSPIDAGPAELEDAALQSQMLAKVNQLPRHCPGCGAPSQTVSPAEAGFYTLTRQGLRNFFGRANDAEALNKAHQDDKNGAPICDRCHNLLHHSVGTPIFHPSIQSIHDIIEESPFQHNYIYHVVDAADFPMSIIPTLQQDLHLPRLRTQNRRSKHINYSRGRMAEVNFIITRADLLAPSKEQVDGMMPYLREVIRESLGYNGKNVRLGNLRCVSAHRGWWTKQVKEDIWSNGGAAWMVGKVNVGKSSLFDVAFPKNRSLGARTVNAIEQERHAELFNTRPDDADQDRKDELSLDVAFDSLLPPARAEVPFPTMPIASSLPGTTASPIRIPFGGGKGELIDLPGISRSTLDQYVLPSERSHLVMRNRVSASQHTIKPGQSLLIGGGLIRITPTDPDIVVLAYPFLPIPVHVTNTDKAIAMEQGQRDVNIPSIMDEGVASKIKFAKRARLQWDVTRQRAGPLTSKKVAGLKPHSLPFVVWGADLVVEGVGWVELVVQTRRKRTRAPSNREDVGQENPFPETEEHKEVDQTEPDSVPSLDVFSPEGGFVAVRRPMNAWLLDERRRVKTPAGARPRRSMSSARKSDKGRAKAAL